MFMYTLECKFLFNYLQLRQTYAILSVITQHAFRSTVDSLGTLWWSRLIWYNFIKVADNWIKICRNSQPFGNKCQRILGGRNFLTHTVHSPWWQQGAITIMLWEDIDIVASPSSTEPLLRRRQTQVCLWRHAVRQILAVRSGNASPVFQYVLPDPRAEHQTSNTSQQSR